MKQRYRKTLAGFIWVVLNPMIMFGVQSLVFKKFLRLDIPNYFLFLVSGLLPWIFLTQTLQMTAPIYVYSAELLKSFRINPLVLVISQVMDNLFNFLFAFIIIFIPVAFMSDVGDLTGLWFMPLNLMLLILGTSFLSVFVSVFNVFFRDTSFVLNFGISVVFFMTPIFYPKHFMPQGYQWIIYLNPFYYFIEPFRVSIINFNMHEYLLSLARGSAFLAVIMAVTILYWKKKRNEFYYYL